MTRPVSGQTARGRRSGACTQFRQAVFVPKVSRMQKICSQKLRLLLLSPWTKRPRVQLQHRRLSGDRPRSKVWLAPTFEKLGLASPLKHSPRQSKINLITNQQTIINQSIVVSITCALSLIRGRGGGNFGGGRRAVRGGCNSGRGFAGGGGGSNLLLRRSFGVLAWVVIVARVGRAVHVLAEHRLDRRRHRWRLWPTRVLEGGASMARLEVARVYDHFSAPASEHRPAAYFFRGPVGWIQHRARLFGAAAGHRRRRWRVLDVHVVIIQVVRLLARVACWTRLSSCILLKNWFLIRLLIPISQHLFFQTNTEILY